MNGNAFDGLAWSVSISADGSTVAASAPGTGFAGNHDERGVYVFQRPQASWSTTTETGFLGASDAQAGDELGLAVSIDHDGLTVAALSNTTRGGAYIFSKPALRGWSADPSESARLAPPVAGLSVGLSGDGSTVLIGAPLATVGSHPDQGATYVFSNAISPFLSFSVGSLQLSSSRFSLNASLVLAASSPGLLIRTRRAAMSSRA